MPYIPSLDLTNQSPAYTYTASVMTATTTVNGVHGNLLSDGSGSLLTQLLFVTTSYAQTASVFAVTNTFSLNVTKSTFSVSSSWATKSLTSISSSFSSKTISSSYAFTSSWAINAKLSGQATSAFSSNTSTSASWASKSIFSISSSFASKSLSSSYVIGYIIPSVSSGSLSMSVSTVSSNNNYYLSMVSGSNGQQPHFVDTSLTFNPLTNTLTTPILNATSITGSLLGSSSYARTASISITSSRAFTASYISPSAGAVVNAGPLTGSATTSGFGFASAAEFITFIQSITASMQQFNSLLTKLRSQGLIS